MDSKKPELIFLTARKWSFKKLHRVVLSKLISIFSGKYVHCALIYRKNNIKYVRDIDFDGVRHYTLIEYLNQNKGRDTIITLKQPAFQYRLFEYNAWCKFNKTKYEYKNLFFSQPIKIIFGEWIGRETINRRTCSEDGARGINILLRLIEYPDRISPTELFNFLKKYSE